jgi:amino acid transporter
MSSPGSNTVAAATTGRPTEQRLAGNSLGLFETTSSTLANIAPALSVFLTIPVIVASMGAMAPWAFVIAAVAILCTGNSLIEFTRRIPSAGGFISYLTRAAETRRRSAGTFAGSVAFYLLLLIYPVSVSSLAVFFGSWTASYAGWPAGAWIWMALISMAIAVPFLLKGTSISVRLAFLLFLVEAVALVVLSVIVLIKAHHAIGVPFHAVDSLGFKGLAGLSFSLAIFGFVGWENSGPLGEESRNPRRTIPRTVVISILLVMVVLFVSAYALVVGFAGWQGTDDGIRTLASGKLSAPYLSLADHYANWLHFVMFLIGLTSSLGGFVAASLPGTRYFFHGAQAGLLPRQVALVSKRTGVPWVAMSAYIILTAFVTVLLDLVMHNAGSIAGDEAGISTVPLLMIYAATCLMLPLFIWKVDRASFSVTRHGLLPLVGAAVAGYGIWESIKPGQGFPADRYWIFVLLYVVLAVAGAVVAMRRRRASHEALARGLENA